MSDFDLAEAVRAIELMENDEKIAKELQQCFEQARSAAIATTGISFDFSVIE